MVTVIKIIILFLILNLDMNMSFGQSLMPMTTNLSIYPRNLVASKGKIFFIGHDTTAKNMGLERIWSIDSTGNNLQPILINIEKYIGIAKMISLNNLLYFSTTNPKLLNADPFGAELYISDGTAEGSYKSFAFPVDYHSFEENNYAIYNGKIYYMYRCDHRSHHSQLWVSDGSVGGSHMIKEFTTGQTCYAQFTPCNDKIFFSVDDGINGRELWAINTQTNIANLVKDICPGKCSSIPFNFKVFNGKLYFSACDDCMPVQSAFGKVWVTDGTSIGTHTLSPSNASLSDRVGNYGFTEYDNKLYFTSADVDYTINVIDGATVRPFAKKGIPFGVGGNNLYFASQGILWKTDGSSSGTTLVKDFNSYPITERLGSPQYAELIPLSEFKNQFYFLAKNELWVTDDNIAVKPLSAPGFSTLHVSTPHTFYNAGASSYFINFVYSKDSSGNTVYAQFNPQIFKITK